MAVEKYVVGTSPSGTIASEANNHMNTESHTEGVRLLCATARLAIRSRPAFCYNQNNLYCWIFQTG